MSENALEIRGLEKSFASFRLGPIDLTVPLGAIYGFVGPNGSGKTTTLDLIISVLLPQIVKLGLRDTTRTHAGFVALGIVALCAAAFVNHRTLTRLTSSSAAYRRQQPQLGVPTPPGRR